MWCRDAVSIATLSRNGAAPRFITPRSPERATLGPRVADVARALGKPFLPWQHQVADVALELDPATGYLAYESVILVVMRQQGKSELMLPLMTHRSLGFDATLAGWVNARYGTSVAAPGSQRTMYLAQGADQARAKWRDIHLPRIQKSSLADLLIDARLRQNQEQMLWANGSTWVPGSATAKTAGTGDSLDLGVIDEAWAHDARTELGLRPTMLTRPWRQLWIVSMVPGPSRIRPSEWAYLREKIAMGRARVEAGLRSGVCYIEFSAVPGMDPGDPATWYSCMPALGHTVPERAVAADFDAFSLADFEAEYLGWEPKVGTPGWLVVPESVWSGLRDRHTSRPEPIALAISATADQATASIGLAGLLDGDTDRVELQCVDRRPGIEWCVDRLVELAVQWEACAMVVDPSGAAASLIEPLERALDAADVEVPVLRPNSREVSAAAARLVTATGLFGDSDEETPRRRLSHWGQQDLDRSVASANRRYVGTQWRFEAAVPGADMSPVESVALAMWGGDHVDWAGASYDIASSLG